MNGNLVPDPINGHTSMAGAIADGHPASRRPDRLLAGVRQFPAEDRTNLWSPCSNCSSDENNSPTTLNTFNWDKPALEDKTVDFGWPPAQTTRNNGRSPQSKDYSKKSASSKEKGGSYANLHRAGANTSQEYKATENKHSPKKEHQLRQGCGSVSECSLTENLYPTVERKGKSTNPFVESSSDSRDTEDEYYERSEEEIVREREDLRNVAWFQAGIPREIALEVLSEKSEGAFIVRQSTTKPGCYALSLRVPRSKNPTGIAHYLILRTNKGYKIKGFTKEFSSLRALITHHSVMPELLPCTLDLSRPSVRDAEREFAETEQKACDIFSDIHWLMTES